MFIQTRIKCVFGETRCGTPGHRDAVTTLVTAVGLPIHIIALHVALQILHVPVYRALRACSNADNHHACPRRLQSLHLLDHSNHQVQLHQRVLRRYLSRYVALAIHLQNRIAGVDFTQLIVWLAPCERNVAL